MNEKNRRRIAGLFATFTAVFGEIDVHSAGDQRFQAKSVRFEFQDRTEVSVQPVFAGRGIYCKAPCPICSKRTTIREEPKHMELWDQSDNFPDDYDESV